ncbi:MAG: hypothetical protein NTY53_23900, partial [Kiritimatiellaeota bacterium]|nr:hypothetical protein [Kiritimatiellota bacterium]
MKKLLMLAFLAVTVVGCRSPQGDLIRPLPDDTLRSFIGHPEDPRRYAITMYSSDDGPVFVGANRLHPGQQAVLPFASRRGDTAPVIEAGIKGEDSLPFLLDTSARESWLRFEAANTLHAIPLGTDRAYGTTPRHVRDDIFGFGCLMSSLVLDPMWVENFVVFVRAASGSLGMVGRNVIKPSPDGVLGCTVLREFSYIQMDFEARLVTMTASLAYRPNPDRLIAAVPLLEKDGPYAVSGMVDGKKVTIVLDTGGDFEIALPKMTM